MIRNYILFILLALLGVSGESAYAREISIQSPDGKLKVNIELKDKVYYSIYSGNDLLLDHCSLTLTLGQ